MKKIIIVNNNMHLGGVQKALVNLLRCIHEEYDVTLVLFHPAGELMKDIPSNIRILPVRSAYRYLGMTRHDISGKPYAKLARSFFAAISRIFGRDWAVRLMAVGQKKLTGFDAVISYLHDGADHAFYGGCNDFVLRHIDARKKITFLHCDYQLCGANTIGNSRRYEKFDTIAACSDGCGRIFTAALPALAGKVKTVPNCQDYDSIRRAAELEPVKLPDSQVNIVTVARLGREKGVERAVEALAHLNNPAVRYHYYILGDGILRPHIEELICRNGLEDRITLVGEKANPYGYMKAADLLLIPSVSEAAPMVIGEAACLGTPVLSTRTSSADEMITGQGFGWVCDNNIDALTDTLNTLLADPEKIAQANQQIRTKDLNNENAVTRFSAVLQK